MSILLKNRPSRILDSAQGGSLRLLEFSGVTQTESPLLIENELPEEASVRGLGGRHGRSDDPLREERGVVLGRLRFGTSP